MFQNSIPELTVYFVLQTVLLKLFENKNLIWNIKSLYLLLSVLYLSHHLFCSSLYAEQLFISYIHLFIPLSKYSFPESLSALEDHEGRDRDLWLTFICPSSHPTKTLRRKKKATSLKLIFYLPCYKPVLSFGMQIEYIWLLSSRIFAMDCFIPSIRKWWWVEKY